MGLRTTLWVSDGGCVGLALKVAIVDTKRLPHSTSWKFIDEAECATENIRKRERTEADGECMYRMVMQGAET